MKHVTYDWKTDSRLRWKDDFPFTAPAIHSVAALHKQYSHRVRQLRKKLSKAAT